MTIKQCHASVILTAGIAFFALPGYPINHNNRIRGRRGENFLEGDSLMSLDPKSFSALGVAGKRRKMYDRKIQELVDAAPPLTAEQKDRLRALLGDGGAR